MYLDEDWRTRGVRLSAILRQDVIRGLFFTVRQATGTVVLLVCTTLL